MTIKRTGVAILVGLSMLVALPARAQPNRPGSAKPDAAEFAALERPVAFEISPSTGTLKETAQRGQELIWIGKTIRASVGFRSPIFRLASCEARPEAKCR